MVDRITLHVLENTEDEFNVYNFLGRGSDERQYNAPGIDLPVGSLMRSKYHEYPEYHTSADNLDFVTDEALKQTLDKYICCLDAIDNNHIYKTTVLCEPHLSKYNLYETLGRKGDNTHILFWNPSRDRQLSPIRDMKHKFNRYNFPVKTSKDMLVIFPAWLEHEVGENKTSEDRISISFNIMLRGRFGEINSKESSLM